MTKTVIFDIIEKMAMTTTKLPTPISNENIFY